MWSTDGQTDRQTDRPTDRQTDISKTIYPLFFEGGHNNWKIIQGKVIILEHCTPQYNLSTYEVSSWYLKYFLRYAPNKNVGQTDRRRLFLYPHRKDCRLFGKKIYQEQEVSEYSFLMCYENFILQTWNCHKDNQIRYLKNKIVVESKSFILADLDLSDIKLYMVIKGLCKLPI
jgi:hypothetical protein